MTIGEYLRAKYEKLGGIVSITRAESKVLGIHYPLRAGWYRHHQGRQISAEQERLLEDVMLNRRGKKKKYASAAVKVLQGGEPVLSDLGEQERQHLLSIIGA